MLNYRRLHTQPRSHMRPMCPSDHIMTTIITSWCLDRRGVSCSVIVSKSSQTTLRATFTRQASNGSGDDRHHTHERRAEPNDERARKRRDDERRQRDERSEERDGERGTERDRPTLDEERERQRSEAKRKRGSAERVTIAARASVADPCVGRMYPPDQYSQNGQRFAPHTTCTVSMCSGDNGLRCAQMSDKIQVCNTWHRAGWDGGAEARARVVGPGGGAHQPRKSSRVTPPQFSPQSPSPFQFQNSSPVPPVPGTLVELLRLVAGPAVVA